MFTVKATLFMVPGWNVLTSHSIVGEPFAELIHNNEEDTEWVATHIFALVGGEKVKGWTPHQNKSVQNEN